ncbi:MAG: DNA polymerase III subunit beta [Acidimicrobiales bacterium]
MRFRCERDVLAEALSLVCRVVPARSSGPTILSGARLELAGGELCLSGSDLDSSIRVWADVMALEPGTCLVPARLLSDIVRSLAPGAVTVESTGEEVSISSGRARFGVRVLPVEEYPRLAAPDAEATLVSSEHLSEALRQVVRAASSDDSRPMLTGVLLSSQGDGLRLVATDSYRLALRDVATGGLLHGDEQVLVPARALAELQRLLGSSTEVSVRIGPQEASFSVGRTTLTTRLLDSAFPDYHQLLPASSPSHLVASRAELLDALRRVRLLARDVNTPVRLALETDQLALSVTTSDLGQAAEDMDAKYEGPEMAIAFNPAYLADGIDALMSEEVSMNITDALKPVTLRAVPEDSFVYLLMPIRVS